MGREKVTIEKGFGFELYKLVGDDENLHFEMRGSNFEVDCIGDTRQVTLQIPRHIWRKLMEHRDV